MIQTAQNLLQGANDERFLKIRRNRSNSASFLNPGEILARHTRAMDAFARVAVVAAYLFLNVVTVCGTLHYIAMHDGPADAVFDLNVLARIAVAIFLATFMGFVTLRSRPRRKAAGLLPRITAFTGSFMMLSLPLFPAHEMPLHIALLSAVLIFVGDGLAVFVVWRLGRSVSLMAEARRLITAGPYAIVRHPLYLVEEAAILGIWLQFASPTTLAMLIVHALFQFQRMLNEEQVLHAEFAEYESYASTTPRLIPGL